MRAFTLVTALILAASVASADCPSSGDGVVVTPEALLVAAPIRFDLYARALDPAALPVIDAVARRLRACPRLRVQVQVHTDTRRVTSFNARASQAIAELVAARLITQGVAPDRVVACGYGESRPLPGRPPQDPSNNRVEWDLSARPCDAS